MSPITPPLNPKLLPGDDTTSSQQQAQQPPSQPQQPSQTQQRQGFTHTTQETPTTLPLAPGPEPIDFDTNPDTIALKSAIAVLQLQRQRATADIQRLNRAKEEAVGDPEAFIQDLVAGKVNNSESRRTNTATTNIDLSDDDKDEDEDKETEGKTIIGQKQREREWVTLPKPQDVVRCPPINWSQYAVVGDSLDKLHAEQVSRPTQGTPAAYIPGHAGMYEFRAGDGRQEAYQGIAVPYNPVKDRVDRKSTSKARRS
ncbi:hypothetical protein NQ176_g4751 [Zarea fungicola]|uniref:Uncharacterized protein n=1 Tax=Zarea fungicola TaxID=93591 RepID=A0ACC1ND21_9HYPO|nr:hypothetical protein NQ176_g4751 [Lecanicillium fungicola]